MERLQKTQDRIENIIVKLRPMFVIIAIMGLVFVIIGFLNMSSQLGPTFLVIGVLILGLGIGFARGKDCWCGKCDCC